MKRFDLRQNPINGQFYMAESPTGEYVEYAALSHAAGQEVDKKADWIAENHHDYWVVRVLCAETPRFYSIRKSDGQMLELPHKDSPFVPFPAVARSDGEDAS